MSRTPRSDTARRADGFTLVELLVVIGIIALLISILLPSLNRARQSANSIYCQANLRSIYQAVAIYAVSNKDFIPSGDGVVAAAGGQPAINYWVWYDTISIQLGSPANPAASGGGNQAASRARVFRDKDTAVYAGDPDRAAHYTANIKLFQGRPTPPMTATPSEA